MRLRFARVLVSGFILAACGRESPPQGVAVPASASAPTDTRPHAERRDELHGGLAKIWTESGGDCANAGAAMEVYAKQHVAAAERLNGEFEAIQAGKMPPVPGTPGYATTFDVLFPALTQCSKDKHVMDALTATGFYRPVKN